MNPQAQQIMPLLQQFKSDLQKLYGSQMYSLILFWLICTRWGAAILWYWHTYTSQWDRVAWYRNTQNG